jgi:hypothetical protein
MDVPALLPRLVRELGAEIIIVTAAVGGVEPGLAGGTVAVLTDHLNMMGTTPLRGWRYPDGMPAFVPMGQAYDPALAELALERARALEIVAAPGVYAAMSGPAYETPAEIRLIGQAGATVVGMSMVPEVLAARALGNQKTLAAIPALLIAALGGPRVWQEIELHNALQPTTLQPNRPVIVMLGDSHTQIANWPKLTGCHAIANFGRCVLKPAQGPRINLDSRCRAHGICAHRDARTGRTDRRTRHQLWQRHPTPALPHGYRVRAIDATTVGRPSSSTWLTRYKLRSKLLASTMHSTASQCGTSLRRPSSTSITTISSSERGDKL